ncbi:MAG TPA: pitrilysin family protein [Streptosporangiaceae bacterium]|nr:pitrilysin family protein [Streptosporangiaceae bacterium]
MTAGPLVADAPRLANGVEYAVLHRPGAEVTTVSVWILAGSRHESAPGVAHLLEHAVMQCVPAGRSMRVVDEIEAWGGDANAMTTRDHVVLHARVPTADAGAALSVLAAAATTMTFDDDLVAAERRVVQEELRLAAADPTDIVHDVFFAAAYGSHPMGRPVGGTVAGVAELGPADLAAWSRRYVTPAVLRVVVSGGMTPADVHAVLEQSALAALDDSGPGRPADTSPAITSGRRDLPLAADTAAVVIGGPGFALADRRIVAADIVIELLARANSSVLNEEIRSRRGLSYDVSGGASGYRETGAWRIAISTAPEHCDLVVGLATDLVLESVRRGWSADQVRTASRRAAGLLRVEAESTLAETLEYGNYAYVGDSPGWSLAAQLADLAAMDVREVNQAAQLMTEQLVVATAGSD